MRACRSRAASLPDPSDVLYCVHSSVCTSPAVRNQVLSKMCDPVTGSVDSMRCSHGTRCIYSCLESTKNKNFDGVRTFWCKRSSKYGHAPFSLLGNALLYNPVISTTPIVKTEAASHLSCNSFRCSGGGGCCSAAADQRRLHAGMGRCQGTHGSVQVLQAAGSSRWSSQGHARARCTGVLHTYLRESSSQSSRRH